MGDEGVSVGEIGTSVDHVRKVDFDDVSLSKAISYETAEKRKKFTNGGRVKWGASRPIK
jgi:hypothetical protein